MNSPKKIKNNKLSPRTASPATPSPMTVPPPKETFNAFGRLVFAASAVLAFASVAILIPIFAGTIIQLVVSTYCEIPKRAPEAITTKMNNKRYSALRKASAPSLIALEISCILSFPVACFFTQDIFTNIKSRPRIANAIGKKIMFDFIIFSFYLFAGKSSKIDPNRKALFY